MRIEDLKRWHWILISLLLGMALAYTQVELGANADTQRLTIKRPKFDREINQTIGGHPLIKDIVIYPPRDTGIIPQGSTQTLWTSVVKFQRLLPTPEKGLDQWSYQLWYLADTEPPAKSPQPMPTPAIVAWLTELAQTNPHISFRYYWWYQPKYLYPLWIGGTVLVVGGIWPTLLQLMLGAGLVQAREPKPKRESWFARRPQARPVAPPKAVVPAQQFSEQDLERMRKMEENLADFVHAGAESENAPLAAAVAPAPVRPLGAGPQEPVAPVEAQTPQDLNYAGQFWPVAHGATPKPDEAQKADADQKPTQEG